MLVEGGAQFGSLGTDRSGVEVGDDGATGVSVGVMTAMRER